MEAKKLRPLSKLQELFPKTYQRILDFVEPESTTISVGSTSVTLSILVDFHLPFTVFLSKEGAPSARGDDLGDYANLEISMRDGTKLSGAIGDDELILEGFNNRMSNLVLINE